MKRDIISKETVIGINQEICRKYYSYITAQDYKIAEQSTEDLIQLQKRLQQAQLEFENLLKQIPSELEFEELSASIQQKLEAITQFLDRLEKLQPVKVEHPIPPTPLETEIKEEEKTIQPTYVEKQQILLQIFENFISRSGNDPQDDYQAANTIEINSVRVSGPEGFLYFLYRQDPNVVALYQAALNHGLPLAAFRVIEACLECEIRNPETKPNPDELIANVLSEFLPIKNRENQTLVELSAIRNLKPGSNDFFISRIGMLKSQIDADQFEITLVTLPTAPTLLEEKAPTKPRSNTQFTQFFQRLSVNYRRTSLPPSPAQQPKTGFWVNRRYDRAVLRNSDYAEKLNNLEARAQGKFMGFNVKELSSEYKQIIAMEANLHDKIKKYQQDPITYNPAKYAGIIAQYTQFLERIEAIKPAILNAKDLLESFDLQRAKAYTQIPGIKNSR